MYILPYNNTLFLASSYSPALFLSLTTVPPSLKAHRLIINRYPAKSPRQPHNKKVLNSADLCLPHTLENPLPTPRPLRYLLLLVLLHYVCFIYTYAQSHLSDICQYYLCYSLLLLYSPPRLP